MKEQNISDEVANLAYLKGFINNNPTTQSLLQKWLRDKFNIHICIMRSIDPKLKFNGWNAYIGTDNIIIPGETILNYDSYESVLESALLKSLKLIKNE